MSRGIGRRGRFASGPYAFGIACVIAATGCAQILGLDGTTLAVSDATPVDAPSVCDARPACASTTGGSICGQLYSVGTGFPLRTLTPTGAVCGAANDGPCVLQVGALPLPNYFSGTATGMVTGSIDDCGRFTITDFDDTVPDVAVVIGGLDYSQSSSLVFGRLPMPGAITDVTAFAVPVTQQQAWAMQAAGSGTAPDVSSAYLVQFEGTSGPEAGEAIRYSGGAIAGPPMTPWGAYFSGAAFDTLDTTLMTTTASGTALVVPGLGNTFDLGGFRPGRQCKPITALQTVAGALIYVAPTGC